MRNLKFRIGDEVYYFIYHEHGFTVEKARIKAIGIEIGDSDICKYYYKLESEDVIEAFFEDDLFATKEEMINEALLQIKEYKKRWNEE